MENFNLNCPELEKLEEVAGQYDFLVQEGVIYTHKEKERALFLLEAIERSLNDLVVKDESEVK